MHLAVFIRARGFLLDSHKDVEVKNRDGTNARPRKEFLFSDKYEVMKVVNDYFNNDGITEHNVNGRKLFEAYRELRTLISSF